MAGSSGKTSVRKPGILPGFRIFVTDPLAAYHEIVGPLPEHVSILTRSGAAADTAPLFVTETAMLGKSNRSCRCRAERHGVGVVTEQIFRRCDRFDRSGG